jgi:hypothetical protein
MERCNYYSWIYYRQIGSPKVANLSNATFRKIVKEDFDPSSTDTVFDINLTVSSVQSRRDTLASLKPSANGAVLENSASVGSNMGGSDCGRVEVFDAADALTKSGDLDMFNAEVDPTPLCVSDCITDGTTSVSCNVSNTGVIGRRLSSSSNPAVVLSFTGVGSGYDNVNFQAAISKKSTGAAAPPTAEPTKAPLTAAPSTAAPSTSRQEISKARYHALSWLAAGLLFHVGGTRCCVSM